MPFPHGVETKEMNLSKTDKKTELKKIEPKQKEFVHELILNKYNQTKAYSLVYPDNNNPAVDASALLTNPKVRAYLAEVQKKEMERLGLSFERMTNEFADLAFSDISDIMNNDYGMKPMDEIKNIKAIQSVKKKTTYTKEGEPIVEIEVKMHPKYQAMDALAKHIGYFEKDNKQKRPVLNITMDLSTKNLVTGKDLEIK